jgi:hypothetical protein
MERAVVYEVVSCLRGATFTVAGFGQAPLVELGLETAHAGAEAV